MKNFKNGIGGKLNHKLQLVLVIFLLGLLASTIFIQNVYAISFGSKTLSVGDTWNLGNGISITAYKIDAKATPKQAWLILYDSGVLLENKIIKEGDVYYYNDLFITTIASIWSESTGDKIALADTVSSRPLPTTTPLPTVVATTAAPTITAVPIVTATTATPTAVATPGKFRVGPSVTLRLITDVIGTNQDGIAELFMNNPSLNDVTLNVDVRISVPSGIHVYGESFAQAAGGGVVAGTFSVPPGTSRTIIVVIKADKSARIGSHILQFTGLYWPGDNKDAYQPLSLTYPVTVKEPSNNPYSAEASTPTPTTPAPTATLTSTPTPIPTTPAPTTPTPTATLTSTPTPIPTPSASVQLHGEKTDVLVGEDIIFKLSAVNKITKPVMSVQVILSPPSGMSVTSTEFVTSGAGLYTTTYKLEPGTGKNIEVRIKTNQQGDFNVKGEIIYYYGDDKSTAEDQTLNLPIKVREIPKTPTTTPQSPALSFWVSILVFGISYILKKRDFNR